MEPFTIDIPARGARGSASTSAVARAGRATAAAATPDTWEDGANPAYLRSLVEYWREAFDWRAQEARLNRFAHFHATVDGARVHLIHERGRGPAPLPLLLTHGYPDSFYRFYKLIPLLTDPAAHGGDAADAFDVVAPSLPGFGFSEARPGSGATFGFGGLWHELMTKVLGYERFGAHGGDWGGTVTEHLARSHGQSVAGIHLTDVPFFHAFRKPEDPTPGERAYFEAIERFQKETGAYAMIQGTRPRTAAPRSTIRRPGSPPGSSRSSRSGAIAVGTSRRVSRKTNC